MQTREKVNDADDDWPRSVCSHQKTTIVDDNEDSNCDERDFKTKISLAG
jgi:hypothetical protein